MHDGAMKRFLSGGSASGVRLVVTVAAVIAIGAAATVFFRGYADRREREGFLALASTAVPAVSVGGLASLQGGDADLGNPAYGELKATLRRLRDANPDVRFVYLFGLRQPGDEQLYFIADSEPAGSEDYSSPGDPYLDTNEEQLAAFRGGTTLVEGPSSDTWGEWITALAPVKDPDSGKTVALLGMDISTRVFNERIRISEALPIAMTALISAFLVVSWLILRGQRRRSALLAEESEVIRAVFEALPVGVIVSRYPAGELVAQNAQSRAFAVGAGPDGAPSYEFVTAEGHPYPAERVPLAVTLASGTQSAQEDMFVPRAMGNFPVRVTSFPVKDGNGDLRLAVTMLEMRS